ncbi:50S ribosomal protein L6 [bacterium]|nr:50S ribosomal protein L6 [bacterium]MBP9809303.1 50S ribosomal protein L6 [bacterium]
MSRIGKAPIPVPSGVTVQIDDHKVVVKGPKGQLERTFVPEMSFKHEDGKITVTRNSENRTTRSLHGLSRTLLANMVKGVSDGFDRNLEIVGVGYRAAMDGTKLVMQLGYSHPVEIQPPAGVTIVVGKGNVITVSGIDKQAVGDIASFIREKRPPEVYKGKGVKYAGEVIRRKAGKAAGKKK